MFWARILIAVVVLSMLATIVGLVRGVDQFALVVVANLLGVCAGIGWFVAVILAFGPRRSRPQTRVPPQHVGGRDDW